MTAARVRSMRVGRAKRSLGNRRPREGSEFGIFDSMNTAARARAAVAGAGDIRVRPPRRGRDQCAQAVVEAPGARSAGRAGGGERTMRRYRDRSRSLKNTRVCSSLKQQATDCNCANHLLGERIAARHDGVDTQSFRRSRVGKEMGERILVGVRGGPRGGATNRNTKAISRARRRFEEGTH